MNMTEVTEEDAAIIKGMLKRGDKQQWIMAWFGGWLNPGRISEIANCTPKTVGERMKDIPPAPHEKLPPIGPYASGQDVHRALLVLGPVKAAIDRAYQLLRHKDGQNGE